MLASLVPPSARRTLRGISFMAENLSSAMKATCCGRKRSVRITASKYGRGDFRNGV
jgi:hypothetical protein